MGMPAGQQSLKTFCLSAEMPPLVSTWADPIDRQGGHLSDCLGVSREEYAEFLVPCHNVSDGYTCMMMAKQPGT